MKRSSNRIDRCIENVLKEGLWFAMTAQLARFYFGQESGAWMTRLHPSVIYS